MDKSTVHSFQPATSGKSVRMLYRLVNPIFCLVQVYFGVLKDWQSGEWTVTSLH